MKLLLLILKLAVDLFKLSHSASNVNITAALRLNSFLKLTKVTIFYISRILTLIIFNMTLLIYFRLKHLILLIVDLKNLVV